MKTSLLLFALTLTIRLTGQTTNNTNDDRIAQVLAEPSDQEIAEVLSELRKQDLTPKEVVLHDSILLSNSNKLYILSHEAEGLTHYGAIVVPTKNKSNKLPVIVFATGGDGMSKEFNVDWDFNHAAAKFPSFLGEKLDDKFIVVIPSFRGQQLTIGEKKYQSEGNVNDAFGGATTDALALLNVTLKCFEQADENRIAIYGGSRGGTVALLASARDNRIKRAIAIAAPTDMKALYQLYPGQFKLLFFNDLLSGKITQKEARKKFIAISPVYFAKELTMVQLHHDKNDPFVPIEFAEELIKSAKANGKNIEAHFYDEGIHGFWGDGNYWNRVQDFLKPLLE
ncbi:MAG: alpha/beta hydrolase family protein [Allomuricauda sp.]